MLTTPRLQPTPYDPPGYQPIVDKNRILRSYRRLRDAYLIECDRHTRTREDIIEYKRKIEACKVLGKERMKKQEEVRKGLTPLPKNSKANTSSVAGPQATRQRD